MASLHARPDRETSSVVDAAAAGGDPHLTRRRIELDFVRGIAILLVMLVHTAPAAPGAWLAPIGAAFPVIGLSGVNLFFALSGFLVGGLLIRDYIDTGSVPAGRFLIRRAFKIWPPLYVLLLFHLLAGRHPADTFLWQNVLTVQNYFGTSITQTWSLAVEEHFYLGLAALIWWLARRRASFATIMAVLAALATLSIVLRFIAVARGQYHEAAFYTQYRLDSLLFGVMLAAVHWMRPQLFAVLARRRWPLVLAFLAAAASVVVLRDDAAWQRGPGLTIEAIGYCALIALVHQHSGPRVRSFWYRAVAWIGLYSYGIYLWHSLSHGVADKADAMLLARHVPADLRWLVATGSAFAFAIGLGAVMTRLVEWPMLKLRDRLTRGPLPAAPMLVEDAPRG